MKKMTKVAIYVCGGLGNQLFQTACLLSYCKKHNYQPIFDRAHHGELHTKDLFWEQFGWKDIIPEGKLDAGFHTYQENDALYQTIPPFEKSSILLRGYFNEERYFKEHREEIIEIFRKAIYSIHPDTSLKEKVGIHVRRGDYLKFSNVFYTLDENYYRNALQSLGFARPIQEQMNVVVSEDIDWSRENIPIAEYRNGTILDDFHFLMHCQVVIIANSTFSWWAAYLNPYTSIVFFPLEWFKDPRLTHFYKYNVKGWKMVSSKSNQDIYHLLCTYITKKNWTSFLSIYAYLIKEQREYPVSLLNIYDAKNGKKYAEEIHKKIVEEGWQVEGFYRQNLHTLLGSKTVLEINMKTLPCYVIAGESRRVLMEARFAEKGLQVDFVDAVPSTTGEKAEGCGKAHINALRKAIEVGTFPCAIFEDDILFTGAYKQEFSLPKCADAFFLGMSRYGMGGWNQMGVRKLINIQEDVNLGGNQLYQIKNMLSAHGILYVRKEYAVKTLKLVEACLTMKFINDVATARAQEEGNVFCMREPFVVQDVTMAKNRHQKQNNMETYVSVQEFQVKPMKRGLLL